MSYNMVCHCVQDELTGLIAEWHIWQVLSEAGGFGGLNSISRGRHPQRSWFRVMEFTLKQMEMT